MRDNAQFTEPNMPKNVRGNGEMRVDVTVE